MGWNECVVSKLTKKKIGERKWLGKETNQILNEGKVYKKRKWVLGEDMVGKHLLKLDVDSKLKRIVFGKKYEHILFLKRKFEFELWHYLKGLLWIL